MADVLTIQPNEEVEQIRARLAHAQSRHVYVYLPKPNEQLRRPLSLTLLRRTADDLGLDVTVVTRDSTTRMLARHAGLRVRWRLDGDRRENLSRDGQPASSSDFGAGALTLSRSVLFLAAILLLPGLVLAALVLPRATIVVAPMTTPIETTVAIVADPDLASIDVVERRIPARRLEVTLDRQAREPTSARTDVPDEPARGTVVFVNQSESAVDIPAGALVRVGGGSDVAFRTLETVILPAPAGTTVRARVEAVEPGPQGNVPAYTINVLDPSLGLPVAVVNDQPMTGGTTRRVGVVTQEERYRVRDELFQRTHQEVLQALTTQVRGIETLVDESVEVEVVDESFSEQAEADADVIIVDLRLRATGTAVDLALARQLAEEVLYQDLPSGQVLVSGSPSVDIGSVQSVGDGLARVEARATGVARAAMRESDIVAAVRGRPVDEAERVLRDRFPLASNPSITISRGWLGRLPWLPMQIDVVIWNGEDTIG